jgi:uncharacterized protein YjiS (DUF1127 family)
MTRTRDVLDELAEWYAPPASPAPVWHGASGAQCFAMTPEVGLRSAMRHGVVRIVEAFLAWHDRARERRALMELSDQTLRDIGISRAEAWCEAAKRSWRI